MKTAWQGGVSQHPCSTFQAIRGQGTAPVPLVANGPFALQQRVRKIGLKIRSGITLKITMQSGALALF
jgi:hypothetical protein